MYELHHAVELLRAGNYTCVLRRDDDIVADRRRGIRPLLELLDSGKDFSDYAAADKVVGKAAAHLYCLLGVKAVYAGVISQRARAVLENAGIAVTFGTEVSAIRNRAGDGLCPMETAVWDIEDHQTAHKAILSTLQKLQSS